MKISELSVAPLTRAAFAPFGDVIETEGAELRMINNGSTERFHDLALVETAGTDTRVLINIFRGQAFALPIDICMMERHPFGSQAFIPMQARPFLVIVAEDDAGRPAQPKVFLARGDQGVNYHRNVWHHPLLALNETSSFVVVDRFGSENNLEEHFFESINYRITDLS